MPNKIFEVINDDNNDLFLLSFKGDSITLHNPREIIITNQYIRVKEMNSDMIHSFPILNLPNKTGVTPIPSSYLRIPNRRFRYFKNNTGVRYAIFEEKRLGQLGFKCEKLIANVERFVWYQSYGCVVVNSEDTAFCSHGYLHGMPLCSKPQDQDIVIEV